MFNLIKRNENNMDFDPDFDPDFEPSIDEPTLESDFGSENILLLPTNS